MHRTRREGRNADGDILGSFGARPAIANPLAAMGYNGLARLHVYDSIEVLDSQHPVENYGEFIEVRSLARFPPAARAAHQSDAGSVRF